MNRNWIARYYNWADDIIGEAKDDIKIREQQLRQDMMLITSERDLLRIQIDSRRSIIRTLESYMSSPLVIP